ncbi:MAG: polymerase sigma factor [Rhodoglobus sp.]|nr:polymerase sigma factor [Rhodoglobus sp.]
MRGVSRSTPNAAHFEQTVRDNEADVLRYLQRRLQNDADAAEAFGETLLTAWRLKRKIPKDAVESRMWLFTVARNVLLNSRRSLARRSAAVQRLVEEMGTSVASDAEDDLALAVRGAIAALPDDLAELIKLTYWEGFASHEAALILGIPASTARSRLSKARESLRGALLEADPQ